MLESPLWQPLSRSSLVFLLVLDHLLHTPCISSPSHHLLSISVHTANRKFYMAYGFVPFLMILNHIQGHSPVVWLFKCNSTNICATFRTVSTDTALCVVSQHLLKISPHLICVATLPCGTLMSESEWQSQTPGCNNKNQSTLKRHIFCNFWHTKEIKISH